MLNSCLLANSIALYLYLSHSYSNHHQPRRLYFFVESEGHTTHQEYNIMTNFTGICTFPHGGVVSAGLLLAACAALASTTYSIASCRLVVLTFSSNTGSFEDTFSRNPTTSDAFNEYKVALGLFQWLRPNGDDGSWNEGNCIGYQQSMLEVFSELYFEMARGFGSIAVLLAVLSVLWATVNSCIAWNIWQIGILTILLLSGTVATAMSFIVIKSDLCNEVFPESSCAVDEGGLILVAGTILWFAGFLITILFVRPLDRLVDERGISELDRVRAREAAAAKEQRARQREREERREQREAQELSMFQEEEGGINVVDSDVYSDRRPPDGSGGYTRRAAEKEAASASGRGEEYGVYSNDRNQQIDEILMDIQASEDRHQRQSGPAEC